MAIFREAGAKLFAVRIFAGAFLCVAAAVGAAAKAADDEAVIARCLAAPPAGGEGACIGTLRKACTAASGAAAAGDCVRREHAVWDGRLNRAYRTAMSRGDLGQDRRLRDLQREWLKQRDERCRSAGPPASAVDECLMAATAERAIALQRVAARPALIAELASGGSSTKVSGTPLEPVQPVQPRDDGEVLQQLPAWFITGPGEPPTTNAPPSGTGPAAASSAQGQAPAAGAAPQPGAAPPTSSGPGASSPAANAPAPASAGTQQQASLQPLPPPTAPVATARVDVTIQNVQNANGQLVIGLCNKDFSLKGCPYHEIVPAQQGLVTGTFSDIPPGSYAVVAFHDENSNQDLDRQMGIPKEAYAISKEGGGRMIPSFPDSVLKIGPGTNAVAIRLKRFNE